MTILTLQRRAGGSMSAHIGLALSMSVIAGVALTSVGDRGMVSLTGLERDTHDTGSQLPEGFGSTSDNAPLNDELALPPPPLMPPPPVVVPPPASVGGSLAPGVANGAAAATTTSMDPYGRSPIPGFGSVRDPETEAQVMHAVFNGVRAAGVVGFDITRRNLRLTPLGVDRAVSWTAGGLMGLVEGTWNAAVDAVMISPDEFSMPLYVTAGEDEKLTDVIRPYFPPQRQQPILVQPQVECKPDGNGRYTQTVYDPEGWLGKSSVTVDSCFGPAGGGHPLAWRGTPHVPDMSSTHETTAEGALTGGACFVAGTPVSVQGGLRPIEQFDVGMRASVLDEAKHCRSQTDFRSHRVFSFEIHSDQSIARVRMLREKDFASENLLGSSTHIPVALDEMNLTGKAYLVNIEPPPPIEEGSGCLVIATYARDDVTTLFSLTLQDGDQVIGVTGGHRIYSLSQHRWVFARDLKIDERLRTLNGESRVQSLKKVNQPHTVYNIEVDTAHTYHVGDQAILVHNQGERSDHGGTKQPADSKKPHRSAAVTQEISFTIALAYFQDSDKTLSVPAFRTLLEEHVGSPLTYNAAYGQAQAFQRKHPQYNDRWVRAGAETFDVETLPWFQELLPEHQKLFQEQSIPRQKRLGDIVTSMLGNEITMTRAAYEKRFSRVSLGNSTPLGPQVASADMAVLRVLFPGIEARIELPPRPVLKRRRYPLVKNPRDPRLEEWNRLFDD